MDVFQISAFFLSLIHVFSFSNTRSIHNGFVLETVVGAAFTAGLEKGDEILEINGVDLRQINHLQVDVINSIYNSQSLT